MNAVASGSGASVTMIFGSLFMSCLARGASQCRTKCRPIRLPDQAGRHAGFERGKILRPEMIDVAGSRERDRRGIGGEPDREVGVAVEQPVNEAADKRIAGADAVHDLDRIA